MMSIKNIITVVVFVFCSFVGFSQTVTYANKEYKVKGDRIFHGDNDVTSSFSEADRESIFDKLKTKKAKQKEQEKAEKKAKKAEKKREKKEKEQKEKQEAQKNYKNAVSKLEKAEKKYLRLKEKGKLSPDDEQKWLKKIEKLKEKVVKREKRLK